MELHQLAKRYVPIRLQIYLFKQIQKKKKKNLLFSATISELVKKIAGDFMPFPI